MACGAARAFFETRGARVIGGRLGYTPCRSSLEPHACAQGPSLTRRQVSCMCLQPRTNVWQVAALFKQLGVAVKAEDLAAAAEAGPTCFAVPSDTIKRLEGRCVGGFARCFFRAWPGLLGGGRGAGDWENRWARRGGAGTTRGGLTRLGAPTHSLHIHTHTLSLTHTPTQGAVPPDRAARARGAAAGRARARRARRPRGCLHRWALPCVPWVRVCVCVCLCVCTRVCIVWVATRAAYLTTTPPNPSRALVEHQGGHLEVQGGQRRLRRE
jgi:hypothetical protein